MKNSARTSVERFTFAGAIALGLGLASACGAPTAPGGDGDPMGTGATGSGSGPSGSGSAPSVGGTPSTGSAPGSTGGSAGCEGEDCPSSVTACEDSLPGSALLRRLTVREFKALVDATFPGVAGKWAPAFSPDSVSPAGFDNQADLLVVSSQYAGELDSTTESVGQAIQAALVNLLPCSASGPDASCAGEFITKYGKRLFRRPVSTDESTRFVGFFSSALDKTGDFGEAIGWLTRALLSSPAALYRYELGTVTGDHRELDQYEIATALAFTFSGQPPSDALLEKADRGELSSTDVLIAEAEALVMSPAGQEMLLDFFESNFEFGRVVAVTKPGLANFGTLREDMVKETRAYLKAVMLDGNGTAKELLTNPSTYPSKALAQMYGFPAPAQDYAQVTRPAGRGIGLLAQGSVLSIEASPDASSPTQRGLLVFERLLCRERPQVPPGVPPIGPVQTGTITTRQRYEELHAADTICAECHANFDPIGFAFEHYNEFGQYRDNEGGLEIDSTGSVAETSITFSGQEELANGLGDLPDAGACISAYLKTYAFGVSEACLGEEERNAFIGNQSGILDYWTSLAKEPHFRTRRAQ